MTSPKQNNSLASDSDDTMELKMMNSRADEAKPLVNQNNNQAEMIETGDKPEEEHALLTHGDKNHDEYGMCHTPCLQSTFVSDPITSDKDHEEVGMESPTQICVDRCISSLRTIPENVPLVPYDLKRIDDTTGDTKDGMMCRSFISSPITKPLASTFISRPVRRAEYYIPYDNTDRHPIPIVPQGQYMSPDLIDGKKEDYLQKLADMKEVDLKHELFKLCETKQRDDLASLNILCDYIMSDRKKTLQEIKGDKYTETALHLALMLDNEPAAEILIKHGQKDLIVEPYNHDENHGTTALHLVIVKGQSDILNSIMRIIHRGQNRDELFQKQAEGTFFEKRFKAMGLPLILAALSEYKYMFYSLLQYGADLYIEDKNTGNNLVHSLVEYSLYNPDAAVDIFRNDILGEALKFWLRDKLGKNDLDKSDFLQMQKKLMHHKNSLGMTPLMFACRVGAKEMLEALINADGLYKHPQWKYGPVREDYYDVTELDTHCHPSSSLSGLELLVYTTSDRKLPIFDTEPIHTLVHTKWKAYRKWFLMWAVFHLLLVVVFTCCALVRKHQEAHAPTGLKFLAGDIFVFLSTLIVMILEVYDIVLGCITWRRKKCTKNIPHKLQWYTVLRMNGFRPIILIFTILTLTWFILRVMQHPSADVVAAPALIIGWYWCLFFTRAFRNIAIFTVMINRMLIGDMLYFGVAFTIILIGFSVAFLLLVPAVKAPDAMCSFPVSMWSLVRQAVGLLDMDEPIAEMDEHVTLARVLLFCFIMLTMILLLNMLIAAMSDTYSTVNSNKDLLWTKLLAESVFIMERRLPPCLRPHVQFHKEGDAILLEVETVKSGKNGIQQEMRY